jgi:hypothetical protein
VSRKSPSEHGPTNVVLLLAARIHPGSGQSRRNCLNSRASEPTQMATAGLAVLPIPSRNERLWLKHSYCRLTKMYRIPKALLSLRASHIFEPRAQENPRDDEKVISREATNSFDLAQLARYSR